MVRHLSSVYNEEDYQIKNQAGPHARWDPSAGPPYGGFTDNP